MLKQLKNRKQEGFTIIEVLIVLAIAGLILLIVFLAVPALQRNSRNTTAKNDVQNVLGGVSEYEGANNGSLPTIVSGTGTIVYHSTATGSNDTSIKVQGTTVVTTATSYSGGTAGPGVGNIVVILKAQCNGNQAFTANSRSVAAFYTIETTSKPVAQCADS